MAELYTIKLEDAVSGNAYRIAQAYVNVSIAAQDMAKAVRGSDAEMKVAAATNLQFHRTQLMAARAAMTAGNALSKLGPKVGATKAATVQHTAAQREGTAQAFKFSYALNALTNQAINLGFALARRLVSGLVDTAEGMYNVADLASRAHMSFANFYGGQEKGDKTLQESIDIAKRYGFTIEDVVKQMNRFGAAGFTAEQAKGTMRFGADMLAAGRDVNDVKGIFLAMTQIMGKGKLQAEELTQQLAERGINAGRVWQIMAGILHKNVDEVMKLQKAGKIGPGLALNAIVQAGVEGVHGSAIGKAGEKVADETVGGLGRRMGTLVEDAVFQATDKASPALVKGMQSIFKGMGGANSDDMAANLTGALEKIGAFLQQVGPQLPAIADNFTKAFNSAAGFDPKSLDHFAALLPEVATNLGAIAGSLVTIASMLAKISMFTLNPQVGVGKALGAGGMASDIAKGQSPGQKADRWLEGAGDKLGNWLSGGNRQGLVDEGKNVAEGLAKGITSGAPSVSKAASDLGQGAIDSSKDTLQIHSPSKPFVSQGDNIASSLAFGMDQSADLAVHSAAQMSQGTIAAGAGASGLDLRRTVAAGSAAGASMSSSRSLSVSVGDLHFGGGSGGAAGGGDAMSEARSYFEGEFVSMLERHLEGAGA